MCCAQRGHHLGGSSFVARVTRFYDIYIGGTASGEPRPKNDIVRLHNDNVHPHVAELRQKKTAEHRPENLPHPLYSLQLAPSNEYFHPDQHLRDKK